MPDDSRSHDLFLLMLSLSQLQGEDVMLHVFCEALAGIWPGLSFQHGEGDEPAPDVQRLPLVSSGHDYGWIQVAGPHQDLGEVDKSLLRNAVRLLAVLLEKRSQERLIQERKAILEEAVEQRTRELAESEARYRFLFESMGQGVVYQDREGHILEANPAAERILGLTRDQMLGRTSLDPRWRAVKEDGSELPGAEHPSSIALRTGEKTPEMVFGVYNLAGDETRWISACAVPEFRQGESIPFRVFATFTDITDRVRAEHSLKESETGFRALFEHMNEGMALHEFIPEMDGGQADYRFLDVNPAFERHTGMKADDVQGRLASEIFGSPPPLIETYDDVVRTGIPKAFELDFEALGRSFRISTFSPKAGHFATVFSDVTAERRNKLRLEESLREKEMLLKEVHHRVKNNLQIIASLINLQIFSSSSPEAIVPLQESAHRIAAMAMVHEHIYRSESLVQIELSSYVSKLANNLVLSLHGEKHIAHGVDLPELYISADKAIPLGLMLNEIITNALKHAFTNRRKGRLDIHGKLHDGSLRIVIEDDGQGLPKDFELTAAKSLGMQLVTNLVRQLDGDIGIETDHGTRVRLAVPLGTPSRQT